jgi:hypothetical protein
MSRLRSSCLPVISLASALLFIGCGRREGVEAYAPSPPPSPVEPPVSAKAEASEAAGLRQERGYELQVWSAESGQRWLTRVLPLHSMSGENPSAPVISPDGTKIATANGPQVMIVDLRSGKPLAEIARKGGHVVPVRFVAGGTRLLVRARPQVGPRSSALRLYDLTGRGVAVFPDGDWKYSPDGRKAALKVSDPTGTHVKVIDLGTGREIVRSHAAYATWNDVKACALSNDSLAALYHYSGGACKNWVGLWNWKTGKSSVLGFSTGGYHHRLVLSPDGRRLATVGDEATGTVWDTTGERLITRFSSDSIRLSPPSLAGLKATVTSPSGRRVLLTNQSSWAALAALQGKPLTVASRLARLQDDKVEVWDLVPPRRVTTIPLPAATPSPVLLSPDGKRVVVVAQRHIRTKDSRLAWPYQGVVYACWSEGGYSSPRAEMALDRLKKTGANSVAILVTWYMVAGTSNMIAPDARKTPSDRDVLHALRALKRRGFKLVIKPHVDVHDGTWRGEIKPSDPKAWFASYREFIGHYARMAQANQVEMLIVGTELKTLSGAAYRPAWSELIGSLRRIYPGTLMSYAANFDEYRQVCFWDLLDIIGVDAYFPLHPGQSPSVEQLVRGWAESAGHNWVNELEEWRASLQRPLPLVFTEVGYRSADGVARSPWAWGNSQPYNGELQARCYEALFQVFHNRPAFHGVFWWHWWPDPEAGGSGDDGFTPMGKPAEAVLSRWYGGSPVEKRAERQPLPQPLGGWVRPGAELVGERVSGTMAGR